MDRGVAIDLLHMAKRAGPQCEAAEHKEMSGEKSLTQKVGEAIEPYSDDIDELSMKAPMSVSNSANLGQGVPNCASKANGNKRLGTRCLPRFGPSRWR